MFKGTYGLEGVVYRQFFPDIGFFVVPDDSLHYHLAVLIGCGGQQNQILADTVSGVYVPGAQRIGGGIAQKPHGS